MTLGMTLLLIILIIRQLKDNFANVFLVSLLGLVASGCIYIITLRFLDKPNIIIEIILNATPTLFGSLTYLYVKYSISSHRKFNSLDFLHFIPFLTAIPLSYYDIHYQEISALAIILNIILKVAVSLVYFVMSLIILRRFKNFTHNHFSNIDKVDLKWLAFIVKIGLFSFIVYLFFMLLWVFNIPFIDHVDYYSNLIVFIFILPISYYGLTFTSVFARISTLHTKIEIDFPEIIMGEISPLNIKSEPKELVNPEKADQIYQDLLVLMETRKPYLNENLMLEDLAKELNQHSKYLSYVINTKAGNNFFDFINRFRVMEFNRQVVEPGNKQFTFLSIAFNCGFGSKSSFNRAYKSEMGISPSEFIKKQLH